jgi:hypothetical protein
MHIVWMICIRKLPGPAGAGLPRLTHSPEGPAGGHVPAALPRATASSAPWWRRQRSSVGPALAAGSSGPGPGRITRARSPGPAPGTPARRPNDPGRPGPARPSSDGKEGQRAGGGGRR